MREGVSKVSGCLTSATCVLGVFPRALGLFQSGEVLGHSGVDPNGGIEVILCGSHSDGNSIALSHFPSTGPSHMEADDSLLCRGSGRNMEGSIRGSGEVVEWKGRGEEEVE